MSKTYILNGCKFEFAFKDSYGEFYRCKELDWLTTKDKILLRMGATLQSQPSEPKRKKCVCDDFPKFCFDNGTCCKCGGWLTSEIVKTPNPTPQVAESKKIEKIDTLKDLFNLDSNEARIIVLKGKINEIINKLDSMEV